MPLFRPTELRQFLDSLGKRPSRALSQNFLIDGNILNKIVSYAEVQSGDVILEIGAGPGALTQCLLEKGARVLAVEKDKTFAQALTRLESDERRLKVISGDFLELDLNTLFEKIDSLKVVANIPYNITTPLILKLIEAYPKIPSITLMVQKEVAMRFIAKKGTPDYSSLTLLLQYYTDVSFGFTVEPSCFYPPPSVRSAIVQFRLKKPPTQPFPESFIRTAFQQRRKMVRSSLKNLHPPAQIEQALIDLKLNPQARPEELSLENFLALHKLLTS